MIVRAAKIFLAASAGALILLVGLNNLMDYGTNFEVVRHILSMDTIPPSPLTWRAIASPTLHHLCYWFIIAVEFGAAGLTLYGAWRLWQARAREAKAFNAAKAMAVAGLALAFALYFLGFMAVGGEWFQMWRSNGFNEQEPAFRFIGCVGLALIFLNQKDGELEPGGAV